MPEELLILFFFFVLFLKIVLVFEGVREQSGQGGKSLGGSGV